jgi:two-component system, OmpR family, sensor histidine kinase BaeS
MKLRLRLAVTTIAVTIPMIGALVFFDSFAKQRAAEEELADLASGQLAAPDARERCEKAPGAWGSRPPRHGHPPPGPPPGAHGPRRGPAAPHSRPADFFAYDEALRSQSPGAPAVHPSVAEALHEPDIVRSMSDWSSSDVEILLRTPWGEGPCSFVLARGTTEPWLGAVLPPTRIWLAPVVVLFIAVLLAIGPIIRRIRRLTEAVQRSAAAGYEGGVAIEGQDEIAELARAFDAAGRAIRAELADKDRREQALRHFLGNTTHDVMIPLTVLQGHLAALRDRAAEGEPFEKAALVSAMEEAHYIASLIHNLGVVAKLDAAEPTLQRSAVDLNALVGRVVARHRPIARQLFVSLESALPDDALVTEADVTLLEQAVSNVVYNGIRHNRASGHVAVILERAAEDSFCLRVIDDGPGIVPEDLARLVERGFRSNEARTRAPDGQGLGLHIAYRVAELHGFSLLLQPSEYGGLQVELAGGLTPC